MNKRDFFSWNAKIVQHVKFINIRYHINNEEKNTIILIYSEKAFDNIQFSLVIKTLNKLGTERKRLDIIKGIYLKTHSYITMVIENFFSKITSSKR